MIIVLLLWKKNICINKKICNILTCNNIILFLFINFYFSGINGVKCPDDSVTTEEGGCKCVSPCPPPKCRVNQRPVQVKAAEPEIPGSCCPLYDCIPSGNYKNHIQTHRDTARQQTLLYQIYIRLWMPQRILCRDIINKKEIIIHII